MYFVFKSINNCDATTDQIQISVRSYSE